MSVPEDDRLDFISGLASFVREQVLVDPPGQEGSHAAGVAVRGVAFALALLELPLLVLGMLMRLLYLRAEQVHLRRFVGVLRMPEGELPPLGHVPPASALRRAAAGPETRVEPLLAYAACGYTDDASEWDPDDGPQSAAVPLGTALDRRVSCLYCRGKLAVAATRPIRHVDDPGTCWSYVVQRCVSCGWWFVTHRRVVLDFVWDYSSTRHAYAVLRRFDPNAHDAPLELAREFLVRNPQRLARFDPFRFELLLTDCLRDVYGAGEVVTVGGRADRGIDIKVVRANGETTLIQVKRRADLTKREGVAVVRELHGVMLREGVPRGMVITTASGYTRGAHREATEAGRHLHHYSMDLLSLEDVVELLDAPRFTTREPWTRFGIRVDESDPGWPVTPDLIDAGILTGEGRV